MTEDHSPIKVLDKATEQLNKKLPYKPQIVWFNVILFLFLHVTSLYGLYAAFTSVKRQTIIFGILYGYLGNLGITAGYHRLWCHRSYKAKWPLKVLLCIIATIAGQNDIYEWCRDHRVHHKFTDTDADPHNINRGFFFAHMGWLMYKKHPDVIKKGKTVSLDDLWAEPIVRFHRRYYKPMTFVFTIGLPTLCPVWVYGESLINAFCYAGMFRYCLALHSTWLVNSAAHVYGNQPYDKYIHARESFIVSIFASGEGTHNYHHVFPWDYAVPELGHTLNLTKVFIDFMGVLGLAYDIKTTSPEIVKQRMLKTGDGTVVSHFKN